MVTVIELFGMPGAGKTTLTNAAAEFFCGYTDSDLSKAWQCQSQLRRGAHVAGALLDLACVTAAAELAVRAPLANPESLLRLVRLVAKRNWIRSQPRSMLLDQGFLQDLWSILYCAGCVDPQPGLLVRLIRSLYRGVEAHVFFLELDADTASLRISSRSDGESRFDGLQRAVVLRSLTCATPLAHAISRAAADAGLTIKILDGSAPITVLGAQLQAAFATRNS